MVEADPLGIAIKSLSFAGVLLCAAGVVWRRLSPVARSRCFVLGGAGVALAFANPLLPTSALVVLMNASYVAFTSAVLLAALQEAGVVAPWRRRARAPAAHPPAAAWELEAPGLEPPPSGPPSGPEPPQPGR